MSHALDVRGLTVSFGGVMALDHLDLTVDPGTIHGIIGPNGAGKTTALNAITRFLRFDGGSITLAGQPLPRSPNLVARSGVSRTFQAPATFAELSALQNVMVGGYSWTSAGMFRSAVRSIRQRREERELRDAAMALLERVGFEFPLDTRAALLPYGAHRQIEIARSLMSRPRLVLLDEPTAGLTADEVLATGGLLREVRDESGGNLAILIIEHNVPFIFGLCDRVTAMDSGRRIATGTPAEVREVPEVVDSYLGAAAKETSREAVAEPPSRQRVRAARAAATKAAGGEGLEVRSVSAGYGRALVLSDVTLRVAPAELVLLYGRNGAGKSTTLNTIMGSPRPTSGDVTWDGRKITSMPVSATVRRGLGLVPQERGVMAEQSIEDNLRLSTMGLGEPTREIRRRIEEMYTRFPELARRRRQLAGTLSGGERQMVAIAKVLIRRPRLLMLDEPSIGLAPPIVERLRDIVAAIVRDGVSLLVAEQNVWWLTDLTDRAYLLDSGRIVGEGDPAQMVTRESLAESYLGERIAEAAASDHRLVDGALPKTAR